MAMNFTLPGTYAGLLSRWTRSQTNLEEEVFFVDWFKDREWSDDRPLILCKDGGLMAIFNMSGIDPEPMGQEDFDGAAAAIRRAMDLFQLESIEDRFIGGNWVIQNYLERLHVEAPTLAPLERDSRALDFLRQATTNYWNSRKAFDDRLTWVIQFHPKVRSETDRWKARTPDYHIAIAKDFLEELAAMMRRQCAMFENTITGFTTYRPRQGFGIRWMNQEEARNFLWRQVNRREDAAPSDDGLHSLTESLCLSNRSNLGRYYQVDDQYCTVLTFKNPPSISRGNLLAAFQEKCDFPFTLTHTWEPFDPQAKKKMINANKGPAASMRSRSRAIAEWDDEAEDFLGALQVDAVTPFYWKFSAIVTAPQREIKVFEDRVSRLHSWIKTFAGAEPLVEGKSLRNLAEISALPGSGFMNKRQNIVTSLNCGDLAFTFRISTGATKAHVVFGTRRNGYHAFNLFDSRLPNWNSAVLGLPGSGKSLLMNMEAMALAGYPSQIYVIDIGNSYGRLFEWLHKEMPGLVSVMRLGQSTFNFNPFPMLWAMEEREKQRADGTYKKDLGGGEFIHDPVEEAKIFFQGWLDVLLGQGQPLTPDQKNRVDRALKGEDGKGGFYLDQEQYCASILEQRKAGLRTMGGAEPLTSLLTFIRQEAPEFESALEFWTRLPQKLYFDSGLDSLSNAKACYFEVTGLDEQKEVVRPFVAALMGTIWRRIMDPRNLHERKVIIIDEAWKFLADPAFAAIIEGMFRTIRKYNGFVILSTQTPNDIKSGDAIKLLRTMAHQFLYKGFSDPDYFQNHLQMTDAQMKLHQSLQQDDVVREVLHWDQNGDARVFRVEVDPWRYWLVTTNAVDKVIWSRFYSYFGNEIDAMEALAGATSYKTVPSEFLRTRLVEDYAQKKNIP